MVVGLPSLISALVNEEIENDPYKAWTHNYFYTETWANRLAKKYFSRHYGYEWQEMYYPLKDYR